MKIARLALAGAAALALALGASPAMAAKTTLRITLQLPMKSHVAQNLVFFKNEVEKASNGDIAVEIYDSAQLYKDKEVPQAVGSGAIEMGSTPLTRFVGDIPAVDIFYLPFLFNSEKLMREATAKGSPVRAPLDEAILKTGNRVLWWQAYGNMVLLSNDAPIKTPADIKGKKVRVFSKTLGTWIEAAGGVPTLVSGSEQYLAYQRGTVDVGMSAISGVRARSLWEVMNTITRTNNAGVEFIVIINDKFWQNLPDDQKAIIEAAAAKADAQARDQLSAMEAAGFEEAKKHGMTIYDPTPEEVDAWKSAAQPVYDAYLAASGDLGKTVLDAAQNLSK